VNLLRKANKNRVKASTVLNEHSNRSHMVLRVEVVSGMKGEPTNYGCLFLVDLAGSERVEKSAAKGQRLKEAAHINKSLATLGNVMQALVRKASHIPYRDSKLTYLLKDCIGGNSRTLMVVAVCPASDTYSETRCALQFATRVRRVHLGSAKRNSPTPKLEDKVKHLTGRLKKTEKELQKVKDAESLRSREVHLLRSRTIPAPTLNYIYAPQLYSTRISYIPKPKITIQHEWDSHVRILRRQNLAFQKHNERISRIQNGNRSLRSNRSI